MMPSIFLESFSASFDILGQKKNKTFGRLRGVENNKIVLTLQIINESSWNLQNRVSGLILHPLVYSIFHVDGLEKIFDPNFEHVALWNQISYTTIGMIFTRIISSINTYYEGVA